MSFERLQKILARRGVASRRASEELILRGRVKVNGVVVTELGAKADAAKDEIIVDGEETAEHGRSVVIALNKPKGYTSTVTDPHADRTVMELVDSEGRRLFPVGRLDRESRGLILMTDDGELANRLLHPSFEAEKTYEVHCLGSIEKRSIERLISGVELDDGHTLPARVEDVRIGGKNARFRITIREGRKRQVRRMVAAVGGKVVDLCRVEFAGVTLGNLPEGGWRVLSRSEVANLRQRVGLPALTRGKKGSG